MSTHISLEHGVYTTPRLINMTPHPLHIRRLDGETETVEPCGEVVRRAMRTVVGPQIGPFGTVTTQLGSLQDLPAPVPGTIYIVSLLAAQAAWALGREDVVSPGAPVRDEKGQIVGCLGLTVAPSRAGL